MRFPCRPVDASFFETAAMRFKNAVDLDARPDDVFAILDDGDSWPRWFGGMRKVAWTSEKPHGVGSTRTAWLTAGAGDGDLFPWGASHPVLCFSTRPSMPPAQCLRRG